MSFNPPFIKKERIKDAETHLKNIAYNLEGPDDLDVLMEMIGDSKYVLLGEGSHGTHEYYTWRAVLSKRLIKEKNFSFIAVEGDWPDCYRINRFIKNYNDSGENPVEVLHKFNRWPTWMWANWEIVSLISWMRKHNKDLPANKRAGFYGLDVYSLWESMDAIQDYLRKNDKSALPALDKVLECFQPFGRDEGSSYAQATELLTYSCQNEVVNLLAEIQKRIPAYNSDHEAVFSTEQNAFVTVNAESYYRAMIKGGPESWNIRDRHMVETLNRLMNFHGRDAKVIVWEHNTHIGDARATDMFRQGMVNVGQLVKEENEHNGVVRIGFGSYQGAVIAGRSWGAKMRKMDVPPAREGSWEHMLHMSVGGNKIILSGELQKENFFHHEIDHRAIGVVYNPEFERYGNYVPSVLPERYEAFIFLDETKAVHPLHVMPDANEVPETYPWGM